MPYFTLSLTSAPFSKRFDWLSFWKWSILL